jgi:hypothetical protein
MHAQHLAHCSEPDAVAADKHRNLQVQPLSNNGRVTHRPEEQSDAAPVSQGKANVIDDDVVVGVSFQPRGCSSFSRIRMARHLALLAQHTDAQIDAGAMYVRIAGLALNP